MLVMVVLKMMRKSSMNRKIVDDDEAPSPISFNTTQSLGNLIEPSIKGQIPHSLEYINFMPSLKPNFSQKLNLRLSLEISRVRINLISPRAQFNTRISNKRVVRMEPRFGLLRKCYACLNFFAGGKCGDRICQCGDLAGVVKTMIDLMRLDENKGNSYT